MNAEEVWTRIRRHAGTEFRTVTGIPFTYTTAPRTIRLDNTNRSISRTQVERALASWPVSGPGELEGFQGASYLYAILADSRVVGR